MRWFHFRILVPHFGMHTNFAYDTCDWFWHLIASRVSVSFWLARRMSLSSRIPIKMHMHVHYHNRTTHVDDDVERDMRPTWNRTRWAGNDDDDCHFTDPCQLSCNVRACARRHSRTQTKTASQRPAIQWLMQTSVSSHMRPGRRPAAPVRLLVNRYRARGTFVQRKHGKHACWRNSAWVQWFSSIKLRKRTKNTAAFALFHNWK